MFALLFSCLKEDWAYICLTVIKVNLMFAIVILKQGRPHQGPRLHVVRLFLFVPVVCCATTLHRQSRQERNKEFHGRY